MWLTISVSRVSVKSNYSVPCCIHNDASTPATPDTDVTTDPDVPVVTTDAPTDTDSPTNGTDAPVTDGPVTDAPVTDGPTTGATTDRSDDDSGSATVLASLGALFVALFL